MSFSFFTKRTTYASLRLRILGRGMQVFGALMFAARLAEVSYLRSQRFQISQATLDLLLRNALIYGGLSMISYLFIGRALMRREKWGAYAAFGAIAVPAIARIVWPTGHTDPFQTVSQIAAAITTGLICTVWNELSSVADAELAEHGKPPDSVAPFTPRNRGFGEPRNGSPSVAREPARTVEIMSAHAPVSAAIADHVTIARQVPPA